MHWDGGWNMGWMWIGWFILIVVIAGGIGLLFSSTGRRDRGGGETPEEILKRRFANGEIDEPTYEHMLQELRR